MRINNLYTRNQNYFSGVYVKKNNSVSNQTNKIPDKQTLDDKKYKNYNQSIGIGYISFGAKMNNNKPVLSEVIKQKFYEGIEEIDYANTDKRYATDDETGTYAESYYDLEGNLRKVEYTNTNDELVQAVIYDKEGKEEYSISANYASDGRSILYITREHLLYQGDEVICDTKLSQINLKEVRI